MVSVLLITRKFVMDDSKVSFDYRVDSRGCSRPGYLGCDGLSFFIDSLQVLDYAGNQFQWTTKTYNLTKVSKLNLFSHRIAQSATTCRLVSIGNNNTLYLKRIAWNSYKTSKLVALYLKLQQK